MLRLLHFISIFGYTQVMLHLAQATKFSRTFIKLTVLACIGLVVLFIVTSILNILLPILFPKKPPVPTLAFGRIKKIAYPQYSLIPNYQVNTVSGFLPTFPNLLKVYKIYKPVLTLYTLRDIRNRLASLGYSTNEIKISDTVYSWNNDKVPGEYIRYNILTNEFYIYSNYLTDQNQITLENPPNESQAFSQVNGFLGGMSQNLSDIDQLRYFVFYYKKINSNLVRIDNLNEAQVIRVDLFQKSIDNIDIYYPQYEGSTMWFYLTKGGYNPNILEAFFKHQIVDPNTSATYPIITSSQALEELKKNNAFVYNPFNQQNIVITDVSLGYYLGTEDQDYLIPIIVFKGNNFKAYVQALPNSVVF